jgi:hypothetical protein
MSMPQNCFHGIATLCWWGNDGDDEQPTVQERVL